MSKKPEHPPAGPAKERVGPAPKRRRTVGRLGAPADNDADLPTAHALANAPSSTAWSIRRVTEFHPHPPSLVWLCIRSFAHGMQRLSGRPDIWNYVQEHLKVVPTPLIPALSEALREECPTILRDTFISAYLLRGTTVTLTDELPGVTSNTVSAIGRPATREQLVELHLKRLENITDDTVAAVLRKLPSLRVLNLRECIKVGPKSAQAAGTSCLKLTSVNFGYTAITPISLAPLLKQCKHLEVLKVAGIQNWTDATVNKLFTELNTPEDFHLPNLKSLKLRQTSVTDVSINIALSMCPNLRRLDLSFTALRKPPLLLNNTSLEKLSLTSTRVSAADVVKIVSGMTGLTTLALGALGRSEAVAAISNTTAMTMTDDTLQTLTRSLVECEGLESMSLVGNSKLGIVSRGALVNFVRLVGRRCKTLNLSAIPSLRSSDLEGLLSEDKPTSALESLILNSTGVDDDVAPYISSCESLKVLELGNTRVTYAGLYAIVDSCRKLEKLNLTSCRGVDVAHRRRFFEVYEEEYASRS